MENGIISYLLFTGVFLFGIYVLLSFLPFGLWLTALFSGVRIPLLDLIDMKIRRVAPSPIVRSLIMARKAGIKIRKDDLEAHSLAGGDVENVVNGMIIAAKNKKHLSFSKACQMDLDREDLTKEIEA